MVSKLLFRLARHRLLDPAVRFGFAHLSALLPVRRVCETGRIIAFHHPRPAWEQHILFVPKVAVPTLPDVRPGQVPLVRRLIQLALRIASRERFDRDGFALMVNGGAYQDVGQLHFHLASPARELWYECPDAAPEEALLDTEALTAFPHPRPRRTTHVVMLPKGGRAAARAVGGFDHAFIDAAITATQGLVGTLDLLAGGYTLLISARPGPSPAGPCFHLVAGSELA
jgi:histidine triad (HIT) family protein